MDGCLDVMRCVEMHRPSSWRPRNALAETKNIHQLFNRWRAKRLGGRRHGRRAALREGRRAKGRRGEIYILQGRQTRRSVFSLGFWFRVFSFVKVRRNAQLGAWLFPALSFSLQSPCGCIPGKKILSLLF